MKWLMRGKTFAEQSLESKNWSGRYLLLCGEFHFPGAKSVDDDGDGDDSGADDGNSDSDDDEGDGDGSDDAEPDDEPEDPEKDPDKKQAFAGGIAAFTSLFAN